MNDIIIVAFNRNQRLVSVLRWLDYTFKSGGVVLSQKETFNSCKINIQLKAAINSPVSETHDDSFAK